jgi:hypothetical protein
MNRYESKHDGPPAKSLYAYYALKAKATSSDQKNRQQLLFMIAAGTES